MNCSLSVTGLNVNLAEVSVRVCGARVCWLEQRAPISAACSREGREGGGIAIEQHA